MQVESELGEIPKGWQIKGLDNIASYLNGLAMQKYRPETNDFLRVIKIKELGQECTDENSDKASANISEEYIIHNGMLKDFSVLQESPFTDKLCDEYG